LPYILNESGLLKGLLVEAVSPHFTIKIINAEHNLNGAQPACSAVPCPCVLSHVFSEASLTRFLESQEKAEPLP